MKYYVAVDIGGTSIKFGIINEKGKAVFSSKTNTEANKGGNHLVQKIIQIITPLIQSNKSNIKISGIGVSTAGVVDSKIGNIVYANNNLPCYSGTNWKKILWEHFHLPISVCNDVHAASLAEAWVGAGRGYQNFLCITIGTGIGGGAFINGRQFTGSHQRALALGYMNTAGNNRIYERKASTATLVHRIELLTGDRGINGKNVFIEAKSGDTVYSHILENWVDELAKGLANAIFCFDPELIIIGGGVSKEGQPLITHICNSLKKYVPAPFLSEISLRPAECGDFSGIIGAVYNLVKIKK